MSSESGIPLIKVSRRAQNGEARFRIARTPRVAAADGRFPKPLLIGFGASLFATILGLVTALASVVGTSFGFGLWGLCVAILGLIGITVTIDMAKRQVARR